MKGRIACHTLGCKVNQYDTESMLELFEKAGYKAVPFDQEADAYLVNTCTVTGTGDQKSLKLIRRINREHPAASIIVCGCLAQRDASSVRLPGVRLVLGTRHRAQVVSLFEQALRENRVIDATDQTGAWAFEPLSVERHAGKTRATMKIQEGCDRYCAYCVIPYVRGPVRSMPIERVAEEARRLSDAGYRELVVTGIHLTSYGRGMGVSLIDALARISEPPGVQRVRLGSLEPMVVDDAFVQGLRGLPKVCPHFHLSMQSGCDEVLRRMHRRYTKAQYLAAARRLQTAFPGCAITTDVLTGFPGETDADALETLAFVRTVGFARIHVFPYSRRSGTVADTLPDQVPEAVKRSRAEELTDTGNQLEIAFVESLLGTTQTVLFETRLADGLCEGYTPSYVRVRADAVPGSVQAVRLLARDGSTLLGEIQGLGG